MRRVMRDVVWDGGCYTNATNVQPTRIHFQVLHPSSVSSLQLQTGRSPTRRAYVYQHIHRKCNRTAVSINEVERGVLPTPRGS